MKRDLTNTVLRNTAIELGERVGLQPRVLIMRLKAFDSILLRPRPFQSRVRLQKLAGRHSRRFRGTIGQGRADQRTHTLEELESRNEAIGK